MQKITIMIVDDHTLIREACRISLSREPDFIVTEDTGDCNKAIEMASRIRPDIILLDINMPVLNGFEMVEKLRDSWPASKVIALSAHKEIVYVKKMMRLGAKGYLTKDTTLSEMATAILQVHRGKVFICQAIKQMLAEQELNNTGR